MDKLEQLTVFPSTVYVIQKPEFLESVRKISAQYLALNSEESMTKMSGTYAHEPEVAEFAQYISQTTWNILSSQGYAMDALVTFFTEMWTQEHHKHSSMDYHMHGHGSQMSAFYFLDCPPDSCRLVVHDPRQAKVITNLVEKDGNQITSASPHIVLTPSEGMLILTNSWMPHSFTRNTSDTPMRFVHMNLSVMPAPHKESDVEVV